jgi:tetratricopeptide repeat protein
VTSAIKEGFAALDRAEALAIRADLTREFAHIGYLRGNLHFAQGDVEACRRSHEHALTLAQQVGDAECEAQALSGLADALYAQGRLHSAYAAFQRCVAVCDREGLPRVAIRNRCMMAIIDAYFERPADSLAALERAKRDAREIRHRYAEAMALEAEGVVLVTYGRFGEAKQVLLEALSVAREIGARRFEALDLYGLARVLWYEGAHDEARRHAELAWTICDVVGPRFGGPIALGALAYTAASAAVRARFLDEGERLLKQGCVAHCYFGFLRDAMETSLESCAWSDAERYANELEAFVRAEPLPLIDFQVARTRALTAAARGDGDRAALEKWRRHAIDLNMLSAIPALDAALRAV